MRPVFAILRISMVLTACFGAAACGLMAASDDELMGGSAQPDASLGGSGGSPDAGIDVNTPEISAPDAECVWPDKVCPPPPAPGGACVDFDDPRYGCAQDTCAPCDPGPNAEPGCLNHACIVKGCSPGFFSCDGDPATGCETNIWSLDNCGVGEEACGKPCAPARAQTATCNEGKCEIVECEAGWEDCNDNPDDGCETSLRTIEDCGACFKVCTVAPPAAPTCASGVCEPDVCPPGKADCDTNEQDCETDITTTSNCGACGVVCSGPNVATWACNVGTCEVATCSPGWGNCDGDHANGCERDLRSSVDHCGACDEGCSTNNTGSRACSNSLCVPTCAAGYGNCDGPEPGATDNGCETNVKTLSNCGGCGVPCSRANATATCATGICSIASCNAGYGNCDGMDPNGCETNTNTSASHCGACGVACSSNNLPIPACAGGVCSGSCAAGFADCNGNKLTDGCETDIKFSVTNCGSCGNPCAAPPNAIPTCEAGTCSYACNAAFIDCDNNAGNGCECPTSGFTCVDNSCLCDNNPACTNGGTCGAGGKCICNTTICSFGQICVDANTCGSP